MLRYTAVALQYCNKHCEAFNVEKNVPQDAFFPQQ
jgi:hypothetical protein